MWLHHCIILWWQLFTTWSYDSVTKIQYRIVWQRSFITLGDCQEYFLSGKTTLPHYFGPVLSLFSLLQGQKWNFLSKAVQCDMPLFSGSPTFGQKSLGGGTICFLLLFVHQLITFSTILLQLQRIKTTFFDVTLYGTVQIWEDLPWSFLSFSQHIAKSSGVFVNKD